MPNNNSNGQKKTVRRYKLVFESKTGERQTIKYNINGELTEKLLLEEIDYVTSGYPDLGAFLTALTKGRINGSNPIELKFIPRKVYIVYKDDGKEKVLNLIFGNKSLANYAALSAYKKKHSEKYGKKSQYDYDFKVRIFTEHLKAVYMKEKLIYYINKDITYPYFRSHIGSLPKKIGDNLKDNYDYNKHFDIQHDILKREMNGEYVNRDGLRFNSTPMDSKMKNQEESESLDNILYHIKYSYRNYRDTLVWLDKLESKFGKLYTKDETEYIEENLAKIFKKEKDKETTEEETKVNDKNDNEDEIEYIQQNLADYFNKEKEAEVMEEETKVNDKNNNEDEIEVTDINEFIDEANDNDNYLTEEEIKAIEEELTKEKENKIESATELTNEYIEFLYNEGGLPLLYETFGTELYDLLSPEEMVYVGIDPHEIEKNSFHPKV